MIAILVFLFSADQLLLDLLIISKPMYYQKVQCHFIIFMFALCYTFILYYNVKNLFLRSKGSPIRLTQEEPHNF